MGCAISGSEAPREARRAREMLGGIGMGIAVDSAEDCSWESWRVERWGFAIEIWRRRRAR